MGYVGLIGFGITCIEGIEPFIKVSKVLVWFADKWTEIVNDAWLAVEYLVNIDIPNNLTDFLTGVIYSMFAVIGYRHIGAVFKNTASKILILSYDMNNPNRDKSKGVMLWFWELSAELIAMAPVLFILFTLIKANVCQAYGYLTVYSLFSILYITRDRTKVWGVFRRFIATEYSGKPDDPNIRFHTYYSARHVIVSTSLFVSSIILFMMFVNEVSINGDNILNFYKWIMCEADVECLP